MEAPVIVFIDTSNYEYNDDLDMDRKTEPEDDDDYYINDDYWIQEKGECKILVLVLSAHTDKLLLRSILIN